VEIVIKLNAAVNAALQERQVQARLRELQMIPAGGSPAVTKELIEAERRQWGEVVQAAGIKPE
jgi:tripartite-type tricarboxylate transporter receptor subunit TctC